MSSLSYRSRAILSRFPCHFDVVQDGKLMASVVQALSQDIDVLSATVGRVRQAHRLGMADEPDDLLLLAGLHELKPRHLSIVSRLLTALRAAVSVVADPATSEPDRDSAWKTIYGLLNINGSALTKAPEDPRSDEDFAIELLVELQHQLYLNPELALKRRMLRDVIAVHRHGNGTVPAILGACAGYLGLELNTITHSDDGYWHFGHTHQFLQLRLPGDREHEIPAYHFEPHSDIIAIEENPFVDESRPLTEVYDTQTTTIDRNGFDEVPVSVLIEGVDEFSNWPMVANLQTGDGVWFHGQVPDGSLLRIGSDGMSMLDDADVSNQCYSFHGGLYADENDKHSFDFVFGDDLLPDDEQPDQVATFAETWPATDGFDPDRAFPHAGGALRAPTMLVGTTRWKTFVQRSHFGSQRGEPAKDIPAIDIFHAALYGDSGLYDGDLISDATSAVSDIGIIGEGTVYKLGFEWRERKAFTIDVWLPERFAVLDTEESPDITELIAKDLDRHRAAGILVNVRYASLLWTLPEGTLRDGDSDHPVGTIILGTQLNPTPDA